MKRLYARSATPPPRSGRRAPGGGAIWRQDASLPLRSVLALSPALSHSRTLALSHSLPSLATPRTPDDIVAPSFPARSTLNTTHRNGYAGQGYRRRLPLRQAHGDGHLRRRAEGLLGHR